VLPAYAVGAPLKLSYVLISLQAGSLCFIDFSGVGYGSRGSSVGIEANYGLVGQGIGIQFLAGAAPTRALGPIYPVGTWGFFSGVERLGV
jgi:hypothetical protein